MNSDSVLITLMYFVLMFSIAITYTEVKEIKESIMQLQIEKTDSKREHLRLKELQEQAARASNADKVLGDEE